MRTSIAGFTLAAVLHWPLIILAQSDGPPPPDATPPAEVPDESPVAAENQSAGSTVIENEDGAVPTIIVTGSRIMRIEKEGPSPVTVLDGEQIQKQGFSTVAEALGSLSQVNTVTLSGDQLTNSFTPNLTPLDLRGLGPSYTLVLVNGRRVADYPGAVNSESAAVNVGAIPAVAIDRIEILSGGASAIYGSDAVAGVVNIVLKDKIEGHHASVRYGETTEGGGESWRLQFSGGQSFADDRLSVVYGVEYLDRKPIYAFERSRTDSSLDAPTQSGRDAARAYVIIDDLGQSETTYLDPGADTCANFASVGQSYASRPQGFYCGSTTFNSIQTFRNSDEAYSGYVNLSYALSDSVSAYGFASYYQNDAVSVYSAPFWFSGSLTGTIVDVDRPDDFGIGGQGLTYQRLFSPEETGSVSDGGAAFEEQVYEVGGGLKGDLGKNYRYDVYLSTSRYTADVTQRRFVFDAIENYFLGPSLGEAGGFLEGFGIQTYSPNLTRLGSPLTPDVYQSLTDVVLDRNVSKIEVFNSSITGPLAELPAGPLEMAAVLELAKQEYELSPDPGTLPGEDRFWGTSGTGGAGDRDRYAAGLEFRIPLLDVLSTTAALRYDKYDDRSNVDDALTYNFGLEYRPFESVLVRGSTATSFRAPDLHYLFAGESGFFFTADDVYKCRQYEPELALEDCTYAAQNPSGIRQGNPQLEEEEGESYTLGIAVEVTDDLSLTLDYYAIELDNVVGDESIDDLLDVEADCRIGTDDEGMPVDQNSAACANALSKITRLPANPDDPASGETLIQVVTGPINRAVLETDGIDAAGRYRWTTASRGTLTFEMAYSHVLSFKFAQFDDDPVEDIRDEADPNNDFTAFRSRVRGSINWAIRDWDLTLFSTRAGSIPSQFGDRRLPPYIRYNAVVQYSISEKIKLSLIGQNIFNKRPPRDPDETVFPYFDVYHYDASGRELFAQLDISF